MRIIYTKRFLYFFFFLAATAALMFMHSRGWLSYFESLLAYSPRPAIYVFSGVKNGIANFFGYFGQVSEINKKYFQLKDQLRSLLEQNLALQQYKFENELLKKELNFKHNSKLMLIPATVIAKDPTALSQTITLNVGSKDGVAVGSAVVSQGILVGKISELQVYTSKALVITDPQSAVDAVSGTGGYSGILRGSFGSGLLLDMVSQNTKVSPGDLIMTAGLTNQIPKGILIGSIGELQSQKNDLLQKATVISSINLKNLVYVNVVKSN